MRCSSSVRPHPAQSLAARGLYPTRLSANHCKKRRTLCKFPTCPRASNCQRRGQGTPGKMRMGGDPGPTYSAFQTSNKCLPERGRQHLYKRANKSHSPASPAGARIHARLPHWRRIRNGLAHQHKLKLASAQTSKATTLAANVRVPIRARKLTVGNGWTRGEGGR